MSGQQMVTVTVPPGYSGGMTLNAISPDGQSIACVLPMGAFPGQQMQFPYTPLSQPASVYPAGPGAPAVY